MLTNQQRADFQEQGFFRIPGAFSRAAAARMEARVWEALSDLYGVARDAPETWTVSQATGLQPLKAEPVFDPIGGPATIEAIDDLLGVGGWMKPRQWGQFLVNFPAQEGRWRVPSAPWHSDFDYLAPADSPTAPIHGVVVFSYLAQVLPRSGGTLVIAGSHHVVRKFVAGAPREVLAKMKTARAAFLASDPWLQALTAEDGDPDRIERFMETEHLLSGIPVRVVELTGQPGDVVITHPWLIHTPAPNHGRRPRMMRIQRVRRDPAGASGGS